MKQLSHDLRVLTPFLAGLLILVACALVYVHDLRTLQGAVAEQSRLLRVRTELQAVRRALLEAGVPAAERGATAAAPHLQALTDLLARDAGARGELAGVARPETVAPALDALLAGTAEAEARALGAVATARDRLWQRLWLLLGLGGALIAYAAVMLVAEVRARSRLDERLRYEATHDHLTGLPNRRFFMQWTERALAQARRERAQLALLYVDLDGFRRVNDQQGQEIGDRLLRVAGRRFRERVRQSDVLARLGSDEFVILTAISSEPDSVGVLAERLITALEPALLPQFGDRYPVGASVGIAIFPRDGLNADALLHAAEGAMRAAKAGGSNLYRFAGADLASPATT